MPQKVRIALDAMGGDVGASVVIPGAAISLKRHPDAEFLLYGDSAQIEAQLAKFPALKAASRVVHTDVTVAMPDASDHPLYPVALGVVAYGLFVLGLPWETRETAEETIAFAKKIKPSFLDFNIAYRSINW